MLNTEMMIDAYKMLYKIETTLRKVIDREMSQHYGPLWKRKFYAERKDYYHNTVAYFGKYDPLLSIFTQEERQQLYALYPVRNKICHMHLLTSSEYDLLVHCYELVTK